MREAVIVATARTPIGKAYRGAFNNTEAPALGGHVVRHAVERAGLDPEVLAAKTRFDPQGLLNPGKLRSWTGPAAS